MRGHPGAQRIANHEEESTMPTTDRDVILILKDALDRTRRELNLLADIAERLQDESARALSLSPDLRPELAEQLRGTLDELAGYQFQDHTSKYERKVAEANKAFNDWLTYGAAPAPSMKALHDQLAAFNAGDHDEQLLDASPTT
jgi:hypothetical protein